MAFLCKDIESRFIYIWLVIFLKQASCLSYFLSFCLQEYEHSNLPFFAKKTLFSKPGCSVLKAITVTAINFHILHQTDSDGFLVYCYLVYTQSVILVI